MNSDQLKDLLPILKQNNVSYFKMEGFEVSFFRGLKRPQEAIKAPPLASEPFTAPDIKTDELFDYDKILNWSGSADPDPMPLANDEALAAP